MVEHKYRGLLAEPPKDPWPKIDDPRYNPFDPKWQDAIRAGITAQREELVSALFEDCDVASTEDDRLASSTWQRVALTLAQRHVPAFQKKGKPGRDKGPKATDDSLMLEMQALIVNGESIKNAARLVAKRRGVTDEKGIATFETHYHRTLKDWENCAMLVKRWAQHNTNRNLVAKTSR